MTGGWCEQPGSEIVLWQMKIACLVLLDLSPSIVLPTGNVNKTEDGERLLVVVVVVGLIDLGVLLLPSDLRTFTFQVSKLATLPTLRSIHLRHLEFTRWVGIRFSFLSIALLSLQRLLIVERQYLQSCFNCLLEFDNSTIRTTVIGVVALVQRHSLPTVATYLH